MTEFKEEVNIVTRCFDILYQCVCSDHIEDQDYICKKIEEYNQLSDELPKDLLSDTKNYIENYIMPIFDDDYWMPTRLKEYGKFNDEGVFEINSEESLNIICFLFLHNSLMLTQELLSVFSKYLWQWEDENNSSSRLFLKEVI